MNSFFEIELNANSEQADRLGRLQAEFAAACNRVAPIAQQNRCWNRVALHHLSYQVVRAQFPQLGSQMACNVIYSVARTYRTLMSHPASPWNATRRSNLPLPTVRFVETVPVYFDRHTLSVKGSTLSMFTLDGRLRFELTISKADSTRLIEGKLREIVMRRSNGCFKLQFLFSESERPEGAAIDIDMPQYVIVNESEVTGIEPVAA